MTPRTLLPGRRGSRSERIAERWLQQQGLETVARNHRCRQGEIDLVMREADGTLVFVEVRYRGDPSRGGALASVDRHKQKRLVNAARHYLAVHPAAAASACRFDVVAVEPGPGDEPRVEWINNAFLAE